MLAIMQSHYLYQLGQTFEIDPTPVTSMRTDKSPQVQVDFYTNYETLANDCRNGLTPDRNIVVSALEGLDGLSAGGSFGVSKMTSFWDDVYDAYHDEPHRLATQLHAWSHELGHAFGLGHTYVQDQICWADVAGMNPQPSLVMNKTSSRPNHYDYPFTMGEQRALLQAGSAQTRRCLPFHESGFHPTAAWRPHPSRYLRREAVQSFDLTHGEAVSFVWAVRSDGFGTSFRQISSTQWKEASAAGTDLSTWREVRRNDDEVVLRSSNFTGRVTIDLANREVVRTASMGGATIRQVNTVLFATSGGPF